MIKHLHRLRSAPEFFAGKLSAKLHQGLWTSPGRKIPAEVELKEIQGFLSQVGINEGATLFVHSSWESLNSGKFSVVDLLKALLLQVGDSGTLAMPAFPHYSNQKDGAFFDVKRTPSAAGLLSETFRRYPGVMRSINLNHSVCAIGSNSEHLVSDHHKSETSWDKNSPYYRLREIDNSWIVGLGVGHRLKVATSLHCVESALWQENKFFSKLFPETLSYSYKSADGNIGQHCYRKRIGQIYAPKVAKYFAANELIEEVLSGLEVYAISARLLIDRAIELGRSGKTMYILPVPWKFYF